MARDIICRPILLRDIALPRFLLLFGTAFWKKYSVDFHGTGLKILEIHAVMDLRVGDIRFPEENNL